MDEKQAPEKTQWYALRSMRRSILGCKSILTDLHIELEKTVKLTPKKRRKLTP